MIQRCTIVGRVFGLLICLSAGAVLAQTGTTSADLQFNGPANDTSGPAPAAKMDTLDDTITKNAGKMTDVDSFLSGDTQPIPDLDPQRNDNDASAKSAPAADLSPTLPPSNRSAEAPAEQQHMSAKALGGSSADVAALTRRVERLEALIEAQSATLQEMAQQQTQMLPAEELKSIREEIVALRKSFQSTARQNLDAGRTTAQSPETGFLVVENLTGLVYRMNVNGIDIDVAPGRQAYPIVVGNVVTEIRGFEAPRAWGADNFQVVNGQQQLAIQIR